MTTARTMTSSLPAPAMTRPLHDLDAWATYLRNADIPVLADTAQALEVLRANEDKTDANILGEMISSDPLMTLKVLAYASAHRSSRSVTDIKTVTAAIVMMGITPFFKAFGQQSTIEDRLAAEPDALFGLYEALRRAHRGASIALGFAVHRMDPDAPVIHATALLHNFSELLMWCHAPALALQIQTAQTADPTLRSGAAQLAMLNIELADLQQVLMKAWRLPDLMIRIADQRHAEQTNVRCVTLATQLARHTANGWDNPAIPDDIAQIATLLNLSPAAAMHLVQDI